MSTISFCLSTSEAGNTHLRVPNKHQLRTRALLRKRTHSAHHRRRPLLHTARIAHASTRASASAGRVGDRFGGCAGVGGEDLVNDGAGGAVAWGSRGLAGAEDVDLRASTLLKVQRGREGGARKSEEGEGGVHS